MMPYYNYPFSYGRQNQNIQPAAPMPFPQVMPAAEELPEAEMPAEEVQPQLLQPSQPNMMPMMPVMPAQTTMPLCPFQMQPNMMPNMQPNMMPNMMPNIMPSAMPNIMPSTMPNAMPNIMPSTMPNMMPNIMPSAMPNIMPNMMPNVMPNMGGMPEMDMMDDGGGADLDLPFGTEEVRVPVLSNNPPVVTASLFKELTGYPRYGNPSDNADILYTGDRGTWTFDLPQGFVTGNVRADLVIRAVLDDHYTVAANRYSATITVNGTTVHTGRVPLEHGTPAGGRFTNWRELTFRIRNLRRNNRIVIVNTSNAGPGDWIGFDWMEIRIRPR